LKKKIVIISVAAVLSIVVVLIIIFMQKDSFSLKINGREIREEEFLEAAARKRYEVVSYFSEKGSGGVGEKFWEEEIGGELPYERLTQETLGELKHFYAVYGLAEEKGYVEEGSYSALLKRWEDGNRLRKEKIEKGEAVYGLSEYSLELYLEYEMDTIQKSYCNDLDNEGMEITEEERKQYYEENIAYYQREDDRILDYIKIPYGEERMDDGQVKELKSRLTSIYKKMDGKHLLADLAREETLISPYLGHADATSSELRGYSRSVGDILEYAWDLKTGESTTVIDENGSLYLIECTKRETNEPVPIEEVKDNINKTLREQRFDKIIEERAAKASVDGDIESLCIFMKQHIDK
jgi:hypothetical protein